MLTPDQPLVSSYDYRLVALSVIIAIVAAHAALDLAGRVTFARGRLRSVWLTGGAVAMGTGIWSMHYIGMLAFHLPIRVLYDWPTVLLSLLAAVFASAIALFVVSRKRMGLLRASIGSIFMGGGIAAMHYIGMAALRLPATCRWSVPLVLLSIVLAVVISFIALLLTFYFRGDLSPWSWLKISSAVVMGAAIPIMHYTGMAAATFIAAPPLSGLDTEHAIGVSSLSIAGITVITFFVLGLAVLTSLVGRRFSVQAVELKASAHLAAIVESSDDAIISKTLNGVILSWNSGAERMFGYAAKEALGKRIPMLVPPDRATEETDILARIARGEGVIHFETVRTRKDGRTIDVSETVSPMKDRRGNIVGASKIARDITERKVAEAKAKELEERLRARTAQLAEVNEQLAEKAAIVSNSNDAIFSKGLDRKLTSWNPGAERLYGYSAAEIVGREDDILVPEDRRAELTGAMERIARGDLVDSFETVRLRKDGTPVDVHLSISPLRDASGRVRGSSVIARDVTDRKRVEQQFRDSQKLESLGMLAGGIAHDFNNLLTGIMGNASLVLGSLPPSDPNAPLLEQVVLAGEKASHLTRQMLAFAGKARLVTEKINLSALVREISGLVMTSIPKSVELRLKLEDQLPAIEGDPIQLQQLIMNLLINGAEAIGEQRTGTVTVTTEVEEVDDAYIQYCGGKPLVPGTYVSLEVHDTGSGMDEKTRSKIFDPFFTTKFTGRGLGLAAALGIVRGHRGMIRVYSTPGHGSTFKVLVPATEGKAAPPAAGEDQPQLRGSGTVLVVDDEKVVRTTAQATLERFGYTVLTSEDGRAAVKIYRERAAEISAVLLDMTMPVMSGQEAFRQIRMIDPRARIIVSSGYNEVEAVRRFTTEGMTAFLQKPYTAVRLARLVKRVIESELTADATSADD